MEEQKKAANITPSKKQNSQPQKKKNNNKSNAETLKIVQDQVDNELAKVKAKTNDTNSNTTSKKGKKSNKVKEVENVVVQEPKKDAKSLQKIPEQATVVYSSAKPKKHTKLVVSLSLSLILIIALAILSVIFALLNSSKNTIIDGVSIMGVDISGLTKEESKEKINEEIDYRLTKDLIFQHNDQRYQVVPQELEIVYNTDELIDEAYGIGRAGNIFVQNFDIVKTKLTKKNLTPYIQSNSEIFASIVSQMETNFTDCLLEATYTITDNKLTITPGRDGYMIDTGLLKALINQKFTAETFNPEENVIVPVTLTKCKSIDIDNIHTQIYKEAVNASFTQEPYKIVASEEGLDFDISINEAKALITGDKESYTIPLKVLKPEVTTDMLGTEAFPDLLASFSTNYSSSNYNRSTNVALCASKVNGKVLMPGDSLSFNKTVGPRTAARGFKQAPIYSNGTTAMGYGGGSCQVSTTLYNAVLRANLQVDERHCHMFVVGYTAIGTDATVSYGGPDLKFTNNRNYPIKIEVTCHNKNCYVKIYGHKEETEYEVKITSARTGSVAPKTTYQTDSSLGPGEEKVIQSGSSGATSVTYKSLYLNGELVSKEVISRDRYNAHNKVVARGN